MKNLRNLISELRNTIEKAQSLRLEFFLTHQPNDESNYPYDEGFDKRFYSLQKRSTEIVTYIIRNGLKEEFGEDYRGIYPGAGRDFDFAFRMGGRWTLADAAYDGRVMTDRNIAMTYNFMDKGARGELPSKFEVALLKHPFGIDPGLNEMTAFTPPENYPEKQYDKDHWNGILAASVHSLKKGGLLITEYEFPLLKNFVRENNLGDAAYKVIESYEKRMEKVHLPGTGINVLPIVIYEERYSDSIPRLIAFHFYRKKSS